MDSNCVLFVKLELAIRNFNEVYCETKGSRSKGTGEKFNQPTNRANQPTNSHRGLPQTSPGMCRLSTNQQGLPCCCAGDQQGRDPAAKPLGIKGGTLTPPAVLLETSGHFGTPKNLPNTAAQAVSGKGEPSDPHNNMILLYFNLHSCHSLENHCPRGNEPQRHSYLQIVRQNSEETRASDALCSSAHQNQHSRNSQPKFDIFSAKKMTCLNAIGFPILEETCESLENDHK